METCRTRSGEKRAGGLGNFAETRDRSWLELGSRLVGKMEKQELPLHCAVSKQPDPRKERSSLPLLSSSSSRVIARSTESVGEEKGLQSIGLILGRALNT